MPIYSWIVLENILNLGVGTLESTPRGSLYHFIITIFQVQVTQTNLDLVFIIDQGSKMATDHKV
jgi:hypothetical protein